MNTIGELPIVGVMGSGSDSHESLTAEVAGVIATLPANLLTGGGGGVMESVSRHFVENTDRQGICIGIIPCLPNVPTKPKPGYPNSFVEIPILTHLPLSGDRGTELGSRNHINILTSNAIVALPGSAGTESEIRLALDYGKPICVYAKDDETTRHFPDQPERIRSEAQLREFLLSACA